MKRITGWMLALVLVLGLGSVAMAAPGDRSMFSNDEEGYVYIQSMVTVGDTLYMLTGNQMYAYSTGDDSPRVVARQDEAAMISMYSVGNAATIGGAGEERGGQWVQALATDGERLYGIDSNTGEMFALSFADGEMIAEPTVQLDWANMMMEMAGMAEGYARLSGTPVIAGDTLYAMRMDDNYITSTLMAFDLATGKATETPVKHVVAIAAYEPGALLLAIGEIQKGEAPRICSMDGSGAVNELASMKTMSDSGLSYDAQTGTIYFVSGGEVNAVRNGSTEVVNYVPSGDMWGSLPSAMLPDGYYVVSTGEAVVIRNTDPAHKPSSVLKVRGLYSDDVVRGFMEENPDIPLVLSGMDSIDKTTMANEIMGGTASDLYVISLAGGGFDTLYERGYLGELTSDVLDQSVAQMYSNIAELLKKGEKLYAFPHDYYATALGYSPKVLEKIGLTEDDLPRTYEQFIQFISRWEDDYAEDYPELSLFENQGELDMQELMLGKVLSSYVAYCQTEGMPISFNSPIVDKVLEAIEQADLSGFKQRVPSSEQEPGAAFAVSMVAVGDENVPTALFTQYYRAMLTNYMYDDGYKILPLALDEGIPALIEANMSVFVLNPAAEQPELAMKFLTYYAEHMTRAMEINLKPDVNEPLENARYQVNKQEYEAELAVAQQAFDEAKGTEAEQMMKMQLDEAEQMMRINEWLRWSVSAEDIADYRSIQPHLVPLKGSVLTQSSGEQLSEISTLLNRYMDGQLPRAQFLRELDSKLRMMEMEG